MKRQYTLRDNRSWNDLGFGEKIRYSLATLLIVSSIILAFVSFIILLEIPSSVIGTVGLFGSEALGILGIASYFSNEIIKFQSKVDAKLNELDEIENKNN